MRVGTSTRLMPARRTSTLKLMSKPARRLMALRLAMSWPVWTGARASTAFSSTTIWSATKRSSRLSPTTSFVEDRHLLLPLERHAAQSELPAERLLVDQLGEAGTEVSMHLDGGAENALGGCICRVRRLGPQVHPHSSTTPAASCVVDPALTQNRPSDLCSLRYLRGTCVAKCDDAPLAKGVVVQPRAADQQCAAASISSRWSSSLSPRSMTSRPSLRFFSHWLASSKSE